MKSNSAINSTFSTWRAGRVAPIVFRPRTVKSRVFMGMGIARCVA